MLNKKYRPWLRHPHTTAEMRANQEKWHRAKRNRHNLPDLYDDIPVYYEKNWKSKRKTQYRPGKRGQHHFIKLSDVNTRLFELQLCVWKLQDYCETHDIPYRVDTITKFRWVPSGKWKLINGETKFIKNGKYHRSYYIDHYVFNWWSDKDIGIEYIYMRV